MSKRHFHISIVPVTFFDQNCMLVWCTQTMKGAVIDPGGDVPLIEEAIAKTEATFEKILLTHGHIDHAGGAQLLSERLECPVIGPHEDDQPLMDELAAQGLEFGLDDAQAVVPNQYLSEGDEITIGNLKFEVRHIPGHTPGHVIFVNHADGFTLSGDTIFQNSVGRTDFPYSDTDALFTAINEKMLTLPDEMLLLPGHGPATTIGQERKSNPFLQQVKEA
ncbi:MAG: MBL fold metallo-hydrolase [Pseudomonadota bacterium]